MMEEELQILMKERFSKKRYKHLLGVVEVARKLSLHWDENEAIAVEAAYLHDYGKIYKGDDLLRLSHARHLVTDDIYLKYPELLHAKLGAALVEEELDLHDLRLLSAIRSHCYGSEVMSIMDKIIYIADYIEPGRTFEGVEEVRKVAFVDLNKALLLAIDGTLKHVIKRGLPIHTTSVKLRNALLKESLED